MSRIKETMMIMIMIIIIIMSRKFKSSGLLIHVGW